MTRDTITFRNEAFWRWHEPREDAAGEYTVLVAACLERNAWTVLQEGTMLRAASAGLTFPANPKVAPPYPYSADNHSHQIDLVYSRLFARGRA